LIIWSGFTDWFVAIDAFDIAASSLIPGHQITIGFDEFSIGWLLVILSGLILVGAAVRRLGVLMIIGGALAAGVAIGYRLKYMNSKASDYDLLENGYAGALIGGVVALGAGLLALRQRRADRRESDR
jgi:hypothetical protein